MEDNLGTSSEVSQEVNTPAPEAPSSLDQVKETVNRDLGKSSDSEIQSSEGKSEAEKEWKANFKVKAYDKEFEIPEKFRAFINKENEKDFRDTFEKSYALDVMKEKNQKIREANEQYTQKIEKEYAPKLQRFEKIESYLKKGDYDSFFEKAGVSEEKLQMWMLKKLQLRDLPPEQQQVYNEQRAAQQRAEQLEEENLSLKKNYEDYSNQQKAQAVDNQLKELDDEVNSPEVSEIAKSFDQRLGQDGSFKLEVLRRAAMVSKQLGRDVTVKEAVADYLKVIGATVAPKVEQTPGQPAKPAPTLPSLNGKATSPASQPKVKSIDDIRKISKQVIAAASKASRE